MATIFNGPRLREIRDQRHISRVKLGAQIDLDPTAIYAYEKNKANPSVGALCRLVDALGVGMADLFTDDGNDG